MILNKKVFQEREVGRMDHIVVKELIFWEIQQSQACTYQTEGPSSQLNLLQRPIQWAIRQSISECLMYSKKWQKTQKTENN